MPDFAQVYKSLNSAQKKAVDTIDGPLLIVAGPGTGKTQLLSARTANILQKTDTLPQNILCLTFTESGALNMRERLISIIGKAAYDVQISTYHAFGGELIRRYPQYFTETRLEQPIDELGKHELLSEIIEKLSYHDPLKQTRHHLGDLISTISEVKRALLSPDDLRAIAKENARYVEQVSRELAKIFADFKTMPRSYEKAELYFSATLAAVQKHAPSKPANDAYGSLSVLASYELTNALEQAARLQKTNPLTLWKNKWLAKNNDNTFVLAGELENRRLQSLASVLETYQEQLGSRGMYDFDDMIVRAIHALAKNNDLRYSLQEQYLYIMLDEYQDTNAAQARLVQLLTDNPLSEGRPNVMAVGDDDQAIYAFQGAEYSNMLDFYNNYRDTAVVNLRENYRSRSEILQTASNIAGQITERLFDNFQGLSKQLSAANNRLPEVIIERNDYQSDIAELAATAERIRDVIKSGTSPKAIAVLAPRHKELEALAAYLRALDVPVRYEKRENILAQPVIVQLLTMAQLVEALGSGNDALANSLWPQVLSFDFWELPISDIWQISWSIGRHEGAAAPQSWTEALHSSTNLNLRAIAIFFMTLSSQTGQRSAEVMLDYLIGSAPLAEVGDQASFTSPLRSYLAQKDEAELYATLSELTVLRSKLRDYQAAQPDMLHLSDMLQLVRQYEAAGQPMLNTSPYADATDAVQLMTAYKAKGLEFDHVFLLSVTNELWGSASGRTNKLTLPANLTPIRHKSGSEDELLRLFFVAITRAKFALHMSSFAANYSGKATTRLKFLDEQPDEAGTYYARMLPEKFASVKNHDHEAPELQTIEIDWRSKHQALASTPLAALLQDRLASYQLSPTHLNSFCDLLYGGPQHFFWNTILRFPQAPTTSSEFGSATHETLQWLQNQVNEQGALPELDRTLAYFAGHMRARKLTATETALLIERGERSLTAFLHARRGMFTPGAIAERNFKNEGVFVGNAHLAGKIDRLEIDHKNKTITVVDYKTGKPFSSWKSDAKLHKYKQQLYCYKILIEGSHSYAGYTVVSGRLEFVEPDEQGNIVTLPPLMFDSKETEQTKQLLQAMWRHITALDFPNTDSYAKTLTGIRQFEQDLLTDTI